MLQNFNPVLSAEWLCCEVLKKVPHRHVVFSIPNPAPAGLRRYFLYDRKLLAGLSRCAWETLKEWYQIIGNESEGVPGAAVAIQTFGDFLGFNPHCHVLVTDGSFYGDDTFKVAPSVQNKELEAVFRAKVFRLLLKGGKINDGLVDMLMSWRHSGFNVHCGRRIWPDDEKAIENIARYIIRASFSQERMTYIPLFFRAQKSVTPKSCSGQDWKP